MPLRGRSSTTRRWGLLLAGALTAATMLVGTGGAPALGQTTEIYRSWAAFTVQGDRFVAVDNSLDNLTPDDGDVLGLRFAAPADFLDAPNLPRADLDEVGFEAVCGSVEATDRRKRIAVLFDFGLASDAPGGARPPEPTAVCAVLPAGGSSLDAVTAAGSPRTQETVYGTIVCAVDGYPAEDCSVRVRTASPADGDAVAFTLLPAVAADGAADGAAGGETGGATEDADEEATEQPTTAPEDAAAPDPAEPTDEPAGDATEPAAEEQSGGVWPWLLGGGAVLLAAAGGWLLLGRSRAEG